MHIYTLRLPYTIGSHPHLFTPSHPQTCTKASTPWIMARRVGDISDMRSVVTCSPRLSRWAYDEGEGGTA